MPLTARDGTGARCGRCCIPGLFAPQPDIPDRLDATSPRPGELSTHCIRAVLAVAVLLSPGAGQSTRLAAQAQTSSTFVVFIRATPIGNEQVSVERTSAGWTISSSGRIGPPVSIVLRSLIARYDADWRPLALVVDATTRDQAALIQTRVKGTNAENVVTLGGANPLERTDPIVEDAVFLPNPFIAPYEAIAARLRTAAPGSTLTMYQPAQGSFTITVSQSSPDQIQTLERVITARRTRVTFRPPGAPPQDADIWGDENGRLLRLSIPAQSLEVAREDIAAVSTRRVTMSRPNDENVQIPANGFSLAGTVSRPAGAPGPLPAVVLVSGSGPTDRDETAFGIPIFGQLAGALADAGFLVLRYDKRGVGQSGGRPEAATLADYADDLRAAIRFAAERKDVDRRRVAVVGHSEGGSVGLLAAARNGRVSALALIATMGVTGRELNLYQVTHGLERSSRPEGERQATIELQKGIQNAVLTGKGWDTLDIAPHVRRQADTPYFHSFLSFNPERIMRDVRQPILIVQGELDTQVPPSNADRLGDLARRRSGRLVDVVKIPGINHLLVPATTGEVEEYGTLQEKQISPQVGTVLASWLKKAFEPRR